MFLDQIEKRLKGLQGDKSAPVKSVTPKKPKKPKKESQAILSPVPPPPPIETFFTPPPVADNDDLKDAVKFTQTSDSILPDFDDSARAKMRALSEPPELANFMVPPMDEELEEEHSEIPPPPPKEPVKVRAVIPPPAPLTQSDVVEKGVSSEERFVAELVELYEKTSQYDIKTKEKFRTVGVPVPLELHRRMTNFIAKFQKTDTHVPVTYKDLAILCIQRFFDEYNEE